MDFPLFQLHGWGKRSGIQPKTIDSELPWKCREATFSYGIIVAHPVQFA